MADFDVQAARKAGYSDAEIADHLAAQRGFDFGQGVKIGRVSSFNEATQANDIDMVMTVRSAQVRRAFSERCRNLPGLSPNFPRRVGAFRDCPRLFR